jgi:hypothetical protein
MSPDRARWHWLFHQWDRWTDFGVYEVQHRLPSISDPAYLDPETEPKLWVRGADRLVQERVCVICGAKDYRRVTR